MRRITALFTVMFAIFAVAVLAPMKPAHAVLTTGIQVYDGTGDTDLIANWVFGDCNTVATQCDDLSTAESDSGSEIQVIFGTTDPVEELARWEGADADGLSVTATITGSGEIYAGTWAYAGPETVAYLAVKAAGQWALFDYTTSASDRNAGYFDVACLFALTAVDTACNDLTQAQLEVLFGTVFGKGTDRPNAMSHITAYAPLPGAVWLFLSALAGLFGIGYRRRKQAA